MNASQQLLVELLSASIYKHKPIISNSEAIDWLSIHDEASAHQIHAMLYPLFVEPDFNCCMDSQLLALWQKETFLVANMQIQHIQQVCAVLDALNKQGIPVIALKGLILRDLYPHPYLRSMGDADILIHIEDFEQVRNILNEFGYKDGGTTPKHISFYHKDFPAIEVHWILTNQEAIDMTEKPAARIWENAVETTIVETPVLTLSPEDQILHLLQHMVSHLKGNGFGLRQLCDLILYVEANKHIIKWITVHQYIEECGISRFALTIFIICKNLFNMEIPHPSLYDSTIENTPYIEALIDDILNAGVFGKKSEDREHSTKIIRYIEESNSNKRNALSFLFPSAKKLGYKYDYARKHSYLLPIAWLHRFAHNILSRHRIAVKNIPFLSKHTFHTVKVRAKLLRWLELR